MALPFKDKELRKVAAFFNLGTFLLTCGALVQPNWFKVRGARCVQHLSLSQFFAFDDDYDTDPPHGIFDYTYLEQQIERKDLPPCTTSEIITLMRVLILLCFLVFMCSLIGVLINLTTATSKPIQILRRNAVPSIACVFLVIAIVAVCYYTTVILGEVNAESTIQVDYEYGFYMITAAGSLALMASAANLWGAPMAAEEDSQRRNLIEDWDGYDPHAVGPTPTVPSLPPYTPYTTDVAPAHRPPYMPPNLGTQQYFPFDDLSVLPPPPPYTP